MQIYHLFREISREYLEFTSQQRNSFEMVRVFIQVDRLRFWKVVRRKEDRW